MSILKATKRDRGYHMRIWRAERDLTRRQAADHFGIAQSHWSLIEAGHRNASPKVAAQLAKALNQPIELFLGVTVPK